MRTVHLLVVTGTAFLPRGICPCGEGSPLGMLERAVQSTQRRARPPRAVPAWPPCPSGTLRIRSVLTNVMLSENPQGMAILSSQ
jgi:hypothetical protein